MKILKKVILLILDILIVFISVLVIIAITYVFQTKILHKKYADIAGFTAFRVITGSMADTINIGDIVVIKITDKVKPNDIIVYQDNDYFVTHRLVQESGESLITRGDANNSEDVPISRDQVLGKVVMKISSSKKKIEITEGK